MSLFLHARRRVLRVTSSVRVAKGNELSATQATLKRARIEVHGEGNRIRLERGVRLHGTRIEVSGRGNTVVLERGVAFKRGCTIWMRGEGNTLRIGEGTTCEDVYFHVGEDGRTLSVGRDCMFAYGIEIRTSDGHSVLDAHTQQRTNKDRDVTIGDHVWIAAHALVMKGVRIGTGSVVAGGAVVTREVGANVAVAGNPATAVRTGVSWDRILR